MSFFLSKSRNEIYEMNLMGVGQMTGLGQGPTFTVERFKAKTLNNKQFIIIVIKLQ